MPLRDHFRPLLNKKSSWEGFHAMWPASIVRQWRQQLPLGFVAEPRVHLGTLIGIDVGALEADDAPRIEGQGATATRGPLGPRHFRAPRLRRIRPTSTNTKSASSTSSESDGWSPPSSWSAQGTRIDRNRGMR